MSMSEYVFEGRIGLRDISSTARMRTAKLKNWLRTSSVVPGRRLIRLQACSRMVTRLPLFLNAMALTGPSCLTAVATVKRVDSCMPFTRRVLSGRMPTRARSQQALTRAAHRTATLRQRRSKRLSRQLFWPMGPSRIFGLVTGGSLHRITSNRMTLLFGHL